MNNKRIHQIYGIILSIAAVIAGLCLMVECVGIYNSGDQPFSPQAVASAFSGIAIPVYLCLALIVGGWILDGFFPVEKKRTPPEKQYGAILSRLHSKADLNMCPPDLKADIEKQQKNRKLHRVISAALLMICSVVFLCYGANGNNFDKSDITGSMVRAMAWFIPCLAIPFGYGIFTAYYYRGSIQKETALVKQAIAAGAQSSTPNAPAAPKSNALSVLRWALLAVGIGIMIYGFIAGGTVDVLTKAVNICTECVGLG